MRELSHSTPKWLLALLKESHFHFVAKKINGFFFIDKLDVKSSTLHIARSNTELNEIFSLLPSFHINVFFFDSYFSLLLTLSSHSIFTPIYSGWIVYFCRLCLSQMEQLNPKLVGNKFSVILCGNIRTFWPHHHRKLHLLFKINLKIK